MVGALGQGIHGLSLLCPQMHPHHCWHEGGALAVAWCACGCWKPILVSC